MIASLEGKLESVGGEGAVINVGGIGFRVLMPTSDIAAMGKPGQAVKVHTHLHVREDNLSIYGFGTVEGLWLFETLLGVTGLGPKLALALLSALSPEQITTAIATSSAEMLDMVPGVGKKVAHRIILELKDKIGAGWIVTPATQAAQENTDVLAALTALGYSAGEAVKAVASLPDDPKLKLEEKVKLALQQLGRK
jgi:Holliday junction DNA helicase RuvA